MPDSLQRTEDASRPDLVFVDTETTGFSPAHGAVAIEVAAIRVCGRTGAERGRFSSLIAPPGPLDPAASHWAVHGIAREELQRAPLPGAVWTALRQALALDDPVRVRWVAHPARFDQPFWVDWLTRASAPPATYAHPWGCSLAWLKRQRRSTGLQPQWRSARTGVMGPSNALPAWAAALGLVPHGTLHRALTDVALLVRIVQTVRRRGGEGWP